MRIKGIKKKIAAKNASLVYKDMFSPMYNEGYVISIQPPSRRMIKIQTSGELADQWGYDWESKKVSYDENFFLSFPHVVFGIHYCNKEGSNKPKRKQFLLKGLRVAFATSPKPQNLYVPPLFNIGSDLRVCVVLPQEKFSNIEDMTKKAIATFWATEFNDGMFDAFSENYDEDRVLANPKTWQNKTRKNPTWVPSARALTECESFRDFCRVGENLTKTGEEEEDADYDYPDYYS